MKRYKRITRGTLERYARVLGRNSLAYEALKEYDRLRNAGTKVSIEMRNNGFSLRENETVRNYG